MPDSDAFFENESNDLWIINLSLIYLIDEFLKTYEYSARNSISL